MIQRVLLKKNFHDAKWLLASCSVTLFLFCWVRIWLVSRLDTGRFKALLELLPADWRRFLPVDPEWLVTYPGRISLTFEEPIVTLCVCSWAIARGSDAVSGELGRGTMELLLAQPVRRAQVLTANALMTVIGIGVISSATWLGIYAGVHTVSAREEVSASWKLPVYVPLLGNQVRRPFAAPEIHWVPMIEKVDPQLFWPAVVNLFSTGLMLAGLTTLESSCDRYRWRTIGIAVAFYVAQLAIKLIAMSSSELDWLKYATILSAFEPELMVRVRDLQPQATWSFWMPTTNQQSWQFGPSSYNGLLIAIGLTGYATALTVFSRRDLPAPV